jgi:O-antigen/teichoic acid export membrane protein
MIGLLGMALFSEQVLLLIAEQYLPGLTIFRTLSALSLILGYMAILSSYFKAEGHVRNATVVVFLQNLVLFSVSFIVLSLSF